MLLTQFSFRAVRKKPRNYKERLPYVNLKTSRPPIRTWHFSDRNHLDFGPARQGLYSLFDLSFIPFIKNNFGTQNHRFYDWAWMHHSLSPFATRKPAFWCQKDED